MRMQSRCCFVTDVGHPRVFAPIGVGHVGMANFDMPRSPGPGGFWEVRKLLPLLTPQNVGEPSFHVVAPSHPNFGFSEEVAKPGFNGRKYAEAAHKVMLRLGYDKYGEFFFFFSFFFCCKIHIMVITECLG